MNTTRKTTAAAFALLCVSFVGAIATLRAIDHLSKKTESQQTLYIRSPKLLKRLSLGYTGLLADIYWTRAVQYFGYQHYQQSNDFHLLAPLLQIATQLDPNLTPAYQFGSNFLAQKPPNGAGEPDAALELARYGIEKNPDQWRLYYNLGFLYYTEFKDYANAADAFARGSQLPIHNEFMPILAARMAQHAGEFETARMLWITTFQSTKDEQIHRNALDHLTALRVDEDVTMIEDAVMKYRAAKGHLPSSLAELEISGVIRSLPADPAGLPYELHPGGRVEVHDPDNIPYITKGFPPGYQPPKPGSKK